METSKLVIASIAAGLLASCATHHRPSNNKGSENYSDAGLRKTLASHVSADGKVNYKALKQDSQNLARYYDAVAATSPDSSPEDFPTKNAELAYWINAYNATVLWNVLAHYPIASVLDVRPKKLGFFFNQRFTYGGKDTSLYFIENGVIRKRFDDPRIHFALNCASLGCPQLPQVPFSAENLDNELERETRAFINSEKFVFIGKDGNLHLSSIFKWYKKDFIDWLKKNHPGEPAQLRSYLNLYASQNLKRELSNLSPKYKTIYISYDWGLNDDR